MTVGSSIFHETVGYTYFYLYLYSIAIKLISNFYVKFDQMNNKSSIMSFVIIVVLTLVRKKNWVLLRFYTYFC